MPEKHEKVEMYLKKFQGYRNRTESYRIDNPISYYCELIADLLMATEHKVIDYPLAGEVGNYVRLRLGAGIWRKETNGILENAIKHIREKSGSETAPAPATL